MSIKHDSVTVLALLSLLLVGCSRQAPAPAEAVGDAEQDYSQVLRNVRDRSAQSMGVDRLHRSITAFETEMGRQPTNLTELVRFGFLDEIPDAPDGMVYTFNPVSHSLTMVKSLDESTSP